MNELTDEHNKNNNNSNNNNNNNAACTVHCTQISSTVDLAKKSKLPSASKIHL